MAFFATMSSSQWFALRCIELLTVQLCYYYLLAMSVAADGGWSAKEQEKSAGQCLTPQAIDTEREKLLEVVTDEV
ncbi:unnamed protein product [Hydatigera taeniaeformis]|uniref:Secreted protein n=1 Tax=Hydatigena taeniaeformis TaxID=6205 RepID=A0A0R3XCS5_HYDTA|nr:unnamed protein product [Hydatigera taeniaeformis]